MHFNIPVHKCNVLWSGPTEIDPVLVHIVPILGKYGTKRCMYIY